MDLSAFEKVLPNLTVHELEELERSARALRFAIAELPPVAIHEIQNKGLRLTLPGEGAELFAGTVVHSTPRCTVLKGPNNTATVHRFKRRMKVVPKGEPLELRRDARGHYEASRRRGEAWDAVRRDRDSIIDALVQRGEGPGTELGVFPSEATLFVPNVLNHAYKGKIVAGTENHLLHVVRPGQVAVHSLSDFIQPPDVGSRATIQYECGVPTVQLTPRQYRTQRHSA